MIVLLATILSPASPSVVRAAAAEVRVNQEIAQGGAVPIAVQSNDLASDVASVTVTSSTVVGPDGLAIITITIHNRKAVVYNVGAPRGSGMPNWIEQSPFVPILAHRDLTIPVIQLKPGDAVAFTLSRSAADPDLTENAAYLLFLLDVLEGVQVLVTGDFLPDQDALNSETFYTAFDKWQEGLAELKHSAALDLLRVPQLVFERRWVDAGKALAEAIDKDPASLVDVFNLIHAHLGIAEAGQIASRLGMLSKLTTRFGQGQVASTEWDLINAPETVMFTLVDLRARDGLSLTTPVVINPNPVEAGGQVSFAFGVEPINGPIQPKEIFVDGRQSGDGAYWKAWACGGPDSAPCDVLEPHAGALLSANMTTLPTDSPGDWSIRRAVAILDDDTPFVFGATLGSFRVAAAPTSQPVLFFVAYQWPQKEGQDPREHLYRATDPSAPTDVLTIPTGGVPSISPEGSVAIVTSISDQDISVKAFDAQTGAQMGVLSFDRGQVGTGEGALKASPARWFPDGSAFLIALEYLGSKIGGGPITWLQIDRALSDAQVVGHVDGPAASPGMSGDGLWGTYNEFAGPGWQMHLLQLSTGNRTPVTARSSQYARGGSWNVDGSRFAYFEQGAGTDGRIWNTDWTLVTTVPGGTDRRVLHTFSNTIGGSASWSPDGHLLAVAAPDLPETCCSLSELPGTIYLVDAATGAVTKVASFTTSSTARWSNPAWSPDGSRLAFLDAVPNASPVGPFDRLRAKVFLLNLKTGERDQVALPDDVQADNPIVWVSP